MVFFLLDTPKKLKFLALYKLQGGKTGFIIRYIQILNWTTHLQEFASKS